MRRHAKPALAGFTLTEALIALLVVVIALLGVLTLFDMAFRLGTTNISLAHAQTDQRIAQDQIVDLIAMAGIGGLPANMPRDRVGAPPRGVLPDGMAVSVINNVPAGTTVPTSGGLGSEHEVLAGTDILTLRGVFTTEVLHIDPQVPLNLAANGGDAAVTLDRVVEGTENTGGPGTSNTENVVQVLDELRRILEDVQAGAGHEAMIVYDRYQPDVFGVLEFDAASSNLGPPPTPADPVDQLVLGLSLAGTATHEDAYAQLTRANTLEVGGGETFTLGSGVSIQLPSQVGAIGVLEEYRFYVRRENEIPGVPASRLRPVLTRTRFYPGTDVPHPEGSIDIVPDIIDLQVALGIDTTDGAIAGVVEEADPPPVGDRSIDEVLFNDPNDNSGLGNIATSRWAHPAARLRFLRLSTVIQANRADAGSAGSIVTRVEDHDYEASPKPIFNTGNYAKFRKRILQTRVELRNL